MCDDRARSRSPLPAKTVHSFLASRSSFRLLKAVPEILALEKNWVETMWALRPDAPQYIKIRHEEKKIPRKQLAMGRDYQFSGQIAEAVEWHPLVASVRDYLNETFADLLKGRRLNGCLINFYEGPQEYLGPHSDNEKELVGGAPIFTVSFGVSRRFRFKAKEKEMKKALDAKEKMEKEVQVVLEHGDVMIMEGETQKTHKHELRKPVKKGDYLGKRVSLTFRVFAS